MPVLKVFVLKKSSLNIILLVIYQYAFRLQTEKWWEKDDHIIPFIVGFIMN